MKILKEILRNKSMTKAKIDRKKIYDKFNWYCAYTWMPLWDNWEVDHIISKYHHEYYKMKEDPDREENLFPALKIVNYYKQSKNIEQFREYMETFIPRLKDALTRKNNKSEAKLRRIKSLQEIWYVFWITLKNPFRWKFYFENFWYPKAMTHAKCNSCNNLNELIQMTPDTKGYRCECGYSYFNKTL